MRRRGAFAVASLAVLAAACAQLLGIDDVHDDPADAGAADAARGDEPIPGADASGAPDGGDADAALDSGRTPRSDAAPDADAGPAIDPRKGCTSPDGGAVQIFPSVTVFPVGLAIDDRSIYVADANGIRRCSLEGCGSVISVVATTPQTFAVTGQQHVFYSDQSRIDVVDTNGAPLGSVVMAGVRMMVAQDTAQGSQVFFTDPSSVRVLADAPDAAPAVLTFSDGGMPLGLAVGGASLFYVDYPDGGAGRILRCGTGGCPSGATFFTSIGGDAGYAAINADDQAVYWGDPAAQEIRACDLAGCGAGPRTIAKGVVVSSLFSDATAVYWTTEEQYGSVWKAQRDGGAPVQIADSMHYPSNVVANGACVYWTETGNVGANVHGRVWGRLQP